MAELYTNLPPKQENELDKTIETLTTTNYQTDYEFNPADYDVTLMVNEDFLKKCGGGVKISEQP